jgi:hypothetical protein
MTLMRSALVRAAKVARILLAVVALAALSLTAPGQASAVGPASYNGPHVVYVTADGHVHVMTSPAAWYLPGANSDQDVTASARTSWLAVGTPWGWVTSTQEHIVYRSSNGHVHELWRSIGVGRWLHTDLTAAAGTSARAAGDVVGWDDSVRHVVYRGTDAHLHAFTWDHSALRWRDVDVTVASHLTVKVAVDPRYDPIQGKFLYRSTDGHVHLVTWSGVKATDLDVSKVAHAKVPAAGRPTYSAGLQQILYLGTDADVHELWQVPGTTRWQETNLTAVSDELNPMMGDPWGWYDLSGTWWVWCLGFDGGVYGMGMGTATSPTDPIHARGPWSSWRMDGVGDFRFSTPLLVSDKSAPGRYGSLTVDNNNDVWLWYYPVVAFPIWVGNSVAGASLYLTSS